MKNLNLNLDNTLSSNSNTVLSSQRALKGYIDDRRILLNFLQDTTPTTYATGNKWLNTSNYKLYTATSASAWDNGINITIGQIFSFDNLLYYYDGTNLLVYSTKSIVDINSGDETKIWIGTQNEYDNLSSYDSNTIYNITDNSTILSTLLATAQEYTNGAQNKAATAYQVQQSLANYLLLNGGTLNAGATLSFKNTNNGTNTLSFDTNNVLNITNNVTVGSTLTANNIVATSGNIYKTNTSGDTVVWSSTLNNYLPLSGGYLNGNLYVLNSSGNRQISIYANNASLEFNGGYPNNTKITYFRGSPDDFRICNTSSFTNGLHLNYTTGELSALKSGTTYKLLNESDKAVANGIASLDANAKIPAAQIPYATSSTVGGVKVSFDSNTGTLNIIVE